MPTEYSRSKRLGEQIKRELAKLIQFELRDPRFGMITVNFVELSRDFSYAEVNVTVFSSNGDEDDSLDIMSLLNRASSFLRSELARSLKLRKVPHLRFHYDDSLDRGAYVNNLIHRALREDRG